MKISAVFFFRLLSVMVALPLVFIILYPWGYLLLPEPTARLADFPRDVTLFTLMVLCLVPLTGWWLYYRSRRRVSSATLRERRDTRDVL